MTTNRLALPTRLPHAGEIRTGEQVATKTGRTRPSRLEHFRLTGPEFTLRAAADIYGGEPRPWDDAPTAGAWELYTQTDTLHVAVILNDPDVLDSGHWEHWSGGGRLRRCDGQTCEHTVVTGTGDNTKAETRLVPCMCDPENPECKPTTRLRVVLPLIPGLGTWRLVTHSIYAAMEIPGVIEFLRLQGARGTIEAYLRIRDREVKRPGQPTKRFPVVTLDPQVTTSALFTSSAFRDDTWQRHRPQLDTGHVEQVKALEAATQATHPDTQLIRLRWREVVDAAGGDEDAAKTACQTAGLESSAELARDMDFQRALVAAHQAAAGVIDGQEALDVQ